MSRFAMGEDSGYRVDIREGIDVVYKGTDSVIK